MEGEVTIWGEHPLRAHETLLTEALALPADECGRAARMVGQASIAAALAGRSELAVSTGERAQRLARMADRATQAMVAIDTTVVQLQLNRADDADRRIQAAIQDLGQLDSEEVCESLRESGVVLLWAEQYEASEQVLNRVVEAAREARWPMLAIALDTLAGLEFRTGRWDLADAHSAEAVRLARRPSGELFVLASALTTLARVAAARGRETECRAYLGEALELAGPGGLAAAYAATAAGLLELGMDRPERAIAALEPLTVDTGAAFAPVVIQSGPDLVEAYVRAGDARQAQTALRRLEATIGGDRERWARATAARCRGLLAPRQQFEQHFEHALDLGSLSPTPFESARTQLCYGERLRRSQRLTEARVQLRVACFEFDRLGARPWAERARRELSPRRRPARPSTDPSSILTAHETQIASLVRRGATNREIAAALFVTDKTVEYHLSNVFRKLNVRSRTELALRLVSPDSASG